MTATADIIVRKVENAILVPNAALRFTPSTEDTSKETKQSGNGSVMSKLMPHPSRQQKNSSSQKADTANSIGQRVWKLDDGRLVPVTVKTGVSDGIKTEIIEGDIEPGMVLVLGRVSIKK
jgi:HlyD family secretion protein